MNSHSPPSITAEERRVVVLTHSAIAGGSLAAVLELAARDTLTPLQLLALGCFAVAVPTAIAMVILSHVLLAPESQAEADVSSAGQRWPASSYVLAAVDQVVCYLGFLALFWHFHWIVGTSFLLATAFALYATRLTHLQWRRVADQATAQPTSQGSATNK